MDTERALGMLQLSDSLFPAGAFAASGGIEWLFSRGEVTDAASLEAFAVSVLRHQAGPTDCAALAAAFEGCAAGDAGRVAAADEALFASKPVREAREASARSGAQVVRCVSGFAAGGVLGEYAAMLGRGEVRGTYPAAYAVCCHSLGIGKEQALAMMAYGIVSGMVGAALRLGIIDHLEGQGVIHRAKPAVAAAVSRCAACTGPGDMWQSAPRADVIQMAHEKMDPKMFIT